MSVTSLAEKAYGVAYTSCERMHPGGGCPASPSFRRVSGSPTCLGRSGPLSFSSTSARPTPTPAFLLAGLENIKRVQAAAGLLGGGTDFPGEYVAEMTKKGTRIDNFIILSDMMIAPGHQEMNMRGLTVSSLIGEYRRRVNPAMLFVAIDLFGAGKSLVSCTEGGSPNDVLITGFSDHVLRFIAERGNDKQLEYVRGIDRTKRIGEHKPVRPAAAGPGPALVAQPDALMIDA